MVGLEQGRGHGQWVVQVGEGRVYKLGSGDEHALSCLFDGVSVFVAEGFASEAGPRVVVVDDGVGIAEAAFKAPACKAHEGVVHDAGQDTEVKQCGIRNHCVGVTAYDSRIAKSNRDVTSHFRAVQRYQ